MKYALLIKKMRDRLPFTTGTLTKLFAPWLLSSFNNYLIAHCAQLCLTLCNPRDCSPPDSSVLGISPARILEWVAISFSRGSDYSSTGSIMVAIKDRK